jgi:hypothetical protein
MFKRANFVNTIQIWTFLFIDLNEEEITSLCDENFPVVNKEFEHRTSKEQKPGVKVLPSSRSSPSKTEKGEKTWGKMVAKKVNNFGR